jgi:hypothetical protein
MENAIQIALLKRLQLAGFEIYLKNSSNEFEILSQDLENFQATHKLGAFNKDENYEKLAQLGISRDKTVILNHQNTFQIEQALGERKVNKNDVRDHSLGRWFSIF